MPIANAHEVLLHGLGGIYDAEHRFLEGQQFMAQKDLAGDLARALRALYRALRALSKGGVDR